MDQSKEVSIFKFENHELRAKMVNGEPWFVGKDACQMLDIKNVSDALGKLDEDEKDNIALTDTIGRQHSMLFVSLPGLQKLIFRSDKPEANRITRWVTHEVIPAIYATGSYSLPNTSPAQSHSDAFNFHVQIDCTTIQDVRRAKATLSFLERAYAAFRGERFIAEKKPKPEQISQTIPIEEKFLVAVKKLCAQGNAVTVRDISRKAPAQIRKLKSCDIRDLLKNLERDGMIHTKRDGKVESYSLVREEK